MKANKNYYNLFIVRICSSVISLDTLGINVRKEYLVLVVQYARQFKWKGKCLYSWHKRKTKQHLKKSKRNLTLNMFFIIRWVYPYLRKSGNILIQTNKRFWYRCDSRFYSRRESWKSLCYVTMRSKKNKLFPLLMKMLWLSYIFKWFSTQIAIC